MKKRLKNQFLMNYLFMFILSGLIVFFTFLLMDFSNDVLSRTLVKNQYTAAQLMRDDYRTIDTGAVTGHGGGVQVVDKEYRVVLTQGLDTIGKAQLTAAEFTDFLVSSKKVGTTYSYDVAYHAQNNYWLIVTFPTSFRIDFSVAHNREFSSLDTMAVAGVLLAVVLFYLLLLGAATFLFSGYTSLAITRPLRKLRDGVNYVRGGDSPEWTYL